ncbi:hypothetical protein C0991_006679 [Blastosporella zonata]|nr:hypothetical protein C0991_006679 [Blastosporella zonata]
MLSPRPILKRGTPSTSHHLAVHFPPSPSLTTHTFTAYSSAAYDRSPIQVSPNSCALPERGCPGRTYTLDEQPSPIREHHRYYSSRGLHPRAMAKRDAERSLAQCPPLIPDLSSESDESDGFTSPPTASYSLSTPNDIYYNPYAPLSPTALAFLPHPPSSRSPYSDCDDDDHISASPKPRRRRRHDASLVPDRIPDAPEYDVPTIRTPTKKRVPALSKALATRYAVSSFRVEDDGCLGGF